MKITETQTVETTLITDIVCDCCGKSCKDQYGNFEYLSLEGYWGYSSNKDMEHWTAQVCEKCVDEKLEPLVPFHKGDL